MMIPLDRELRRFTIDWELCRSCHIVKDGRHRTGVTPFTLGCFVYHAIHTLKKDPQTVLDAVRNGWDTIYWGSSSIGIILWNKLFNGGSLSSEEWKRVLFPLEFIDTVHTSVTSPSSKKDCHMVFFSRSRSGYPNLYVCTAESYRKTVTEGSALKVTVYRYGQASGMQDIRDGLRREVSSVVIPF
jgi:hypothetical protein|uniref:Uncharacterized protein n=1 Tax=Podoviridae sp. ctz6O13 TaxID=2827757 RepID=A0A8S5TL07_9CAUD|nr:MAG TPA: hypothetical protein [Podoviridae sp. ctz6O13]